MLHPISRRDALAVLASAAAVPWLTACTSGGDDASPPGSTAASGRRDGEALALLDDVANELLALFPKLATSLGLDTGARAGLKSRLTDRSLAGM